MFVKILGNNLSQVYAVDQNSETRKNDGIGGVNSLTPAYLAEAVTEVDAENSETIIDTTDFALAGLDESFFGPGVPTTLNPQREEIVYYEVKDGDTIGSISVDFQITVDTILWANNLNVDDYIKPGDKLVILPTSGLAHKIASGDTVDSIAKKYQAEAEEIELYNKIKAGRLLVGQTLIIPNGVKRQVQTQIIPKNIAQIPQPVKDVGKKLWQSISGWLWPVNSRVINSGFGYRRWGRYIEMHTGLDIDGNTGDSVRAAKSGIVAFAGWRSGYGKTIIINHPDGTETLYGHLSSYTRTKGGVNQGEVIAKVGNTGRSTGSHLHFEIRQNGRPLNPLNYIR